VKGLERVPECEDLVATSDSAKGRFRADPGRGQGEDQENNSLRPAQGRY
jgi:hypothetical protein